MESFLLAKKRELFLSVWSSSCGSHQCCHFNKGTPKHCCPRIPRFTALGAGILTCIPFDRRSISFCECFPPKNNKKRINFFHHCMLAHTKTKKSEFFLNIFLFENGFPLSLRTGLPTAKYCCRGTFLQLRSSSVSL